MKYFDDLPMVRSGAADWFMPDHNWAQIVAEGGVFTDYDVPDSWCTRITYSFIKNKVGIDYQGARLLTDAGISVTQVHAAYKAIQEPRHIPDILKGSCGYLLEREQFGDLSPYRLNSFMSDISRKSSDALLASGIKDVQFFRDMALAYFVVSHRYRSFGGSVEQWHVMVEKVGYKMFFDMVFMGLDLSRATTFADADIDPHLVRELLDGAEPELI